MNYVNIHTHNLYSPLNPSTKFANSSGYSRYFSSKPAKSYKCGGARHPVSKGDAKNGAAGGEGPAIASPVAPIKSRVRAASGLN